MTNTFKILVVGLGMALNGISPGLAQTYLPPVSGNWEQTDPADLGWCSDSIDNLYNWLEDQNSRSFIILKDGKLVLEKYFGNASESSVWYWASAGKTLRALLVGIAQRENALDLNDQVSKHIDTGWTNCCLEKENLVKIHHLLSMTSGLDDEVADPYCTDDTCLRYFMDAGSRWAYHNGPYNLTRNVLESATKEPINQFTKSRVLDLIGMTGSWIPSGYNTIFWSNARSMARFGLLIQNGGDWGFQPVLADTNYFEAMTNTSQNLNLSYGYLWWLNGKSSFMVPQSQLKLNGPIIPDAPDDLIAALGADDQKIYVVPSEGLVIVRQGNSGKFLLPYQFDRELWKRINNLSCSNISVQEIKDRQIRIDLTSEPGKLIWDYPTADASVELVDYQGRSLIKSNSRTLDIGYLPSGMYLLKVHNGAGIAAWKKFTLSR